jgi:hypothetical protein
VNETIRFGEDLKEWILGRRLAIGIRLTICPSPYRLRPARIEANIGGSENARNL